MLLARLGAHAVEILRATLIMTEDVTVALERCRDLVIPWYSRRVSITMPSCVGPDFDVLPRQSTSPKSADIVFVFRCRCPGDSMAELQQ